MFKNTWPTVLKHCLWFQCCCSPFVRRKNTEQQNIAVFNKCFAMLHTQKWTTWSMLLTTCCNVVLHTVKQCCAAPCQQLLSTTIVHSCSRSTTIVQLLLIDVLLFQQRCNNCCSLSLSSNYWSNNTYQYCEFNKCCWTLITTLFRRCSTNNVASTWWSFACYIQQAHRILDVAKRIKDTDSWCSQYCSDCSFWNGLLCIF